MPRVRTPEENENKRKYFVEIGDKEHEMFDRVWYVRHCYCRDTGELKDSPEDIRAEAYKAALRIEEKYGKDLLQGACNDTWEYGRISGWLECLRWCLGLECIGLDT